MNSQQEGLVDVHGISQEGQCGKRKISFTEVGDFKSVGAKHSDCSTRYTPSEVSVRRYDTTQVSGHGLFFYGISALVSVYNCSKVALLYCAM
ncbi:hypothetical protein AVEN_182509-1 [Araneus ventricosus]|uniref:Uncharacterized protein n=1 Tax=Araneus ventricosus TaxID=182803 RepID=A0A4Y2C006_ARAVE|nr:hypothetical protein AVEN_182509-1 [Araneus ventricosus]